MTAKVLVVDDVHVVRKVLEAKLVSEYFEVVTAASAQEALEKLKEDVPDIILLDAMMPEMDGFELCWMIKADPRTAFVPVVMVSALTSAADKVMALQSGADDFITKPVDDIALFARVRNLVRLKTMFDELRMREVTGNALGLFAGEGTEGENFEEVRILVIEEDPASIEIVRQTLKDMKGLRIESDGAQTGLLLRDGEWDLVIISLSLQNIDPLRLCSQMRSSEAMRQIPVLVMIEPDDSKRLVKALDLGVNDHLVKPIDRSELLARTRSQLRRKRYQDRLRESVQRSVELSVTDPLTNLHNRRYMDRHLSSWIQKAQQDGRPLSVMVLDLDHFKSINDSWGHNAGDQVLKEFARRITLNVRGVDLAARFGGEEFVVIMPETTPDEAEMVSNRLVRVTANEPFEIGDGRRIRVTVSIGVATLESDESGESLVERADKALYEAKSGGRNRAVIAAPTAAARSR